MEKTTIPLEKKKAILIMDLMTELSDTEYLKVIEYYIPSIIESFGFDFIFYLSGVDIIENDKLGKLSVSLKGCMNRDKLSAELL